MRQPVLVRAVGGVLAVSPAALAATAPLTGSFSRGDQFIAESGCIATCSFPVAVDLQVRGTYHILLDAPGQPMQLLVGQHWIDSGRADGKYVIERRAE